MLILLGWWDMIKVTRGEQEVMPHTPLCKIFQHSSCLKGILLIRKSNGRHSGWLCKGMLYVIQCVDCLTPLHVIFSEGTKTSIYILCHSPTLAWHSNWNYSSSKKITNLFYIVYIMGADVLATQGARASATMIWVRSRNCGCLVTWFCYQLIAKPGNKTAAVSWPDSYSCWTGLIRSPDVTGQMRLDMCFRWNVWHN